jgi:sigma-B regulation protein RsbU (phosphoserine phosphatase)
MDADGCSILMYNRETNKLEFELAISTEESTSAILKQKISLNVGEGIAGWVAENLQPLLICDVNQDKRFFKNADNQTGFQTKSLIAVPLIGRTGLIGVAEVLNPRNRECFVDYDCEIFQTLCRQVATAIENALFHKESIQRERHKQEMDLASALQRSFLPESPVLKKAALTVSAVNISAAKVGGDLYDFVETVKDKVGVLIGDVSGKGISGALYMAKVISDFRYIAQLADSPEKVLDRLNLMLSKSPRGMFLTAMYVIVDPVTGVLNLSVAGHPPFLWITGGEVKVMSMQSGPPLGIIPIEYSGSSITLSKGDRIFLLTDGVFDAKNRDGQRLEFEHIVEFVRNNMHERQLLDMIVGHVDDFSKGMERADDLTIVELEWGID